MSNILLYINLLKLKEITIYLSIYLSIYLRSPSQILVKQGGELISDGKAQAGAGVNILRTCRYWFPTNFSDK